MGRTDRRSNGRDCLGVIRSNDKCTRARDKSGKPVVMAHACKDCGEWRCKKHCKCSREKLASAEGRSAPRGSDVDREVATVGLTRAVAACKASPLTDTTAFAPVGRPSKPHWELLSVEEWWQRCKADVQTCSELELSSYTYDDPDLQRILEQRLRQKAMALNVYIDKEMLFRGAKYVKSRLLVLRELGANVYICKGNGPRGSYHCKAAVVDRRTLYTGNANFTFKSHRNEEFVYIMKGAAVETVLQRLAKHRWSGSLWQ